MGPKISRDQKRIRDALKRHGHDAAVRVAFDIEQRKEAAASAAKKSTKATRKRMIEDDTIYNWPPPWLTRKIKLPTEKDEPHER